MGSVVDSGKFNPQVAINDSDFWTEPTILSDAASK